MTEELIADELIETLNELFDLFEREPIRTDEDLSELGEVYDE